MTDKFIEREESRLKGELTKKMTAQTPYVVLRHEEKPNVQSGVPDMSVTGGKRTTWLEVKYAAPSVRSRGLQDLTMKQLATQGLALYVIYGDIKGEKFVRIVPPGKLDEWRTEGWVSVGHDHDWVIAFIRRIHG